MDNQIWPGDFFSTAGTGVSGWANQKLTCTPKGSHTDRFHFGVVADPVLNAQGQFVDFETRESIYKGPSTLRFFRRYMDEDIELYRLPGIAGGRCKVGPLYLDNRRQRLRLRRLPEMWLGCTFAIFTRQVPPIHTRAVQGFPGLRLHLH